MRAYNVDLMLHLFENFPESFSASKECKHIEYKPGRFGMEEVEGDTYTATLAENILDTANAIMIKYGIDRAIKYLDEFKKPSEQRNELLAFNRA